MADETHHTEMGAVAILTERAMRRVSDDALHAVTHSFEGGNEDCPTCIAVRERQARYRAEHPVESCPECGRPYDDE